MTKPKIKWHDADFTAVMKSADVERLLMEQAQEIADRAGEGFEAELGTGGQTRSRAFARAVTGKAVAENARHATLLRALGR